MSLRLVSATDQRAVLLDTNRPLGRGGEATVYSINGDRRRAAKVYHEPSIERADKLRALLGSTPPNCSGSQAQVNLAWPEELLLDGGGQTVGYSMPAIRDGKPMLLVYHPKDRKRTFSAGFDFRCLVRTALNLAQAFASVHESGLVIGDVNDANVLVRRDASIVLIDCDSFQVGSFTCPVGRPEYLAPELHGQSLRSVYREPSQDCFALGVLVHQLLMRGFHPFAGPSDLGARIRSGLCHHTPGGPSAPLGAPPLEQLSPALAQLMLETFVVGHSEPSRRPTALCWVDALTDAESEIVGCSNSPSHQHFRHLRHCPECQRLGIPRGHSRRAHGATGRRRNTVHAGAIRWSVFCNRAALLALAVAVFGVVYTWDFLPDTNSAGHERQRTSSKAVRSGASSNQESLPNFETGTRIFKRAFPNDEVHAVNGRKSIAQPSSSTSRSRNSRADGSETLESGSEIYRAYFGVGPF